jgi:RNA polymerase sigma factor for flagellar operon FliA
METGDIATVLPGVRRMARRTPLAENGAMDVDDMEQDAAMGVLDAARRFDPARGTRFATHAYLRARGAVLDGKRALDHVPRSWRAAQRRVLRARTDLVAELGREPMPEELAARLEISTQELRDVEERCRKPESLTEPVATQEPEGDLLTVADVVRDEGALPDELVIAREDAERLHNAVARLPGREQFAIRATWFMDITGRELADLLGVSPSRVAQIRSGAIERLVELLVELGLEAPGERVIAVAS